MEFNKISVTKEISSDNSVLSFCIENVENGNKKIYNFQKGVLPHIKTDDFSLLISDEKYKKLDAFLIPGITCIINIDDFIKFEQRKDDVKDEYEEEKQEITTDDMISENNVEENNESICITKKNVLPSIVSTNESYKVGRIYNFFNRMVTKERRKPICDHKKYRGIINGVDTKAFMSIDFYLKRSLKEFKDADIVIKRTGTKSAAKATWLENEKLFLIAPYAGNLKAFIFIKYEDFTIAYNREENFIELDKVEGKYVRFVKTKKNVNIVEKIKKGVPGYSVKKF